MSDTTTCESCNAGIPASATFCPNCGAKVGGGEASSDPGNGGTAAGQSAANAPVHDDITRITSLPPGAGSAEPHDAQDVTRVIPVASPPVDQPAGAPSWSPPAPAWSPPPASTPPPQPAWAQPEAVPPNWSAPQPAPPQWGAPGAPPPPSSPWGENRSSGTRSGSAVLPAILAFLGALLLVAGVFSPWIDSNDGLDAISGWDFVSKETSELQSFDRTPDPAFLLGIALASVAIGALLLAGKLRGLARLLLAVAGVGAAVILVIDYLGIKDTVEENFGTDVSVTYQFGFWLCVAGAVTLLAASIMPSRKGDDRPAGTG